MRKIIALLAGLSLAASAVAQTGPKFSTSGGVGSSTSTYVGGEPNGGTYTINGTTGTVSTPVINLRPGSAPSSPQNGDCWTTIAGFFCRINGATVGPYASSVGAGTVTQVGLVPPSIFTAGAPVTTNGNLSFTLNSQSANQIFAAPNGSSGTPGFRALVGADVPATNLATSGNGGVTGTLAIGNGGTGGTTPTTARGALDVPGLSTTNTFTQKQSFPAGTTGAASLSAPSGVAPTSPVDGDCWNATNGWTCRVNGSSIAVPATVSTNAALAAVNSGYGRVLRMGYLAQGDVAPLLYTASGSACSLNAGAGDGGSQVPSADGKCWLAVFGGATIDASQFGALGGGLADETQAIQRAIAAAIAFGLEGGGRVFIRPGVHKVASGLTVSSQVLIEGVQGSSIIAPSFAAGDVLTIAGSNSGNSGVTLRGLTFKTSVTRTSGAYVRAAQINYVTIDDCFFTGGYDAVSFTDGPVTSVKVLNSNFLFNSHNNLSFTSTTSATYANVVVEDVWILGPSNAANSSTGVLVTTAGDITLSKVSTVWAGNGLHIQPTPGLRVQALTVADSFFDSGSGYGIYAMTNGGNIDLLRIHDTWVATNVGGGAIFGSQPAGLGGTFRQLDIDGMISANNTGGMGLRLMSNVTNARITGSTFTGNASHGMQVDSDTTKFQVLDNTFGASSEFGTNGGWGMLILAGGSNDYIVAHNRFDANTSGAFSDGGTGTGKVVWPNTGVQASVPITATPSAIWGVDFTKLGVTTLAASGTYDLAVGSGELTIANDSNGSMAKFILAGGAAFKLGGSADIVAGAPGASQVGVTFVGGKYRITNGYATSQNFYFATIKVRPSS